jgi:acyl-CoA hydrolase
MDTHGYFKCSLCQIIEHKMAEICDLIILEVNPNMPEVGGDTFIHISQIDHLVEVDTPVPQLPKSAIGSVEETIGKYIAELVNDGDTIQLGIGSIPDAAALAFKSKKDLGVHTEMIGNSIADLVEAGTITGKKKSLHRGKIIGTFALGDKKLYDFMNNNPGVEILRGSYVNDPFVIAKNDNMVSINSCISVDLTGQINAESIGSRQYSGTGGASDTAYGAIHAKNGRSIIAVKSTVKKGTASSIVPVLAPGAIVSIQRNNIDYVVTEYGIAPLRGRSIKERVNNLIAVAHPDFRQELKAGAEQYWLS